MLRNEAIKELQTSWSTDERWQGIQRPYTAADVARLRGSIKSSTRWPAWAPRRLWHLLHTEDYVPALGAITGNQAMQMVKAGLKAIYLSGWQVAADDNLAGQMYPDQSLYPANSVPNLVRTINNTLQRADQIDSFGRQGRHLLVRAHRGRRRVGFRRPAERLRAHEGDDRGRRGRASTSKTSSPRPRSAATWAARCWCPPQEFVQNLVAARLAADVMDVPTILVARTDAYSATLITSDIDPHDEPLLTGQRTAEGFFYMRKAGVKAAIARGLAYAPYADLLWCETSEPDLAEAQAVCRGDPQAVSRQAAGLQLLAVVQLEEEAGRGRRSPSSSASWARWATSSSSSRWPASMPSTTACSSWRCDYAQRGMAAYAEFQQEEFASEADGYTATKHQREVGTGYFDEVATIVSGGTASTLALLGLDRRSAVRIKPLRLSRRPAIGYASTIEKGRCSAWQPVNVLSRMASSSPSRVSQRVRRDPDARKRWRSSRKLAREFGPAAQGTAAAARRAAGRVRRGRDARLPARDAAHPRGGLDGRARSRPTCRTAASRSPGRPTAR